MNGVDKVRRVAVNVALIVVSVLIDALMAVVVVLLLGLLWTSASGAGLAESLPQMLFIAAAVWLLGAGSLLPRITSLGYLQWGISGGRDDLAFGRKGESGRQPVELSPMGSSIVVAAILVTLGTILS